MEKRLGLGLEGLFGSIEGSEGQKNIQNISLAKIKAASWQPRKEFDEKALKELSLSIQEHGLLQPVLLKKKDDGYEIIAGERRVRAAKLIEMATISAIIMEFDEDKSLQVAMIENLQRENLNAIEKAQGFAFLIEKLGLTRGFVVMSVISFLTCLLFIQFYDWLKVDWLGIEVAKEVRDFGPEWIKKLNPESIIVKILWWPFSKIILIILWALKKGGFVAFVALSVYTDPFITTVYMRKGRHEYNGLSRKDWQMFIASTIVSNGYWAIITFAILESAKLFLKGVIG